MSDFLENLKKSVDEGEFNSEAAKKINALDDMAEEVLEEKSVGQIEESVLDTATAGGVITVSGEEVARLNSEYEEKMKKHVAEEVYLATIATMMNDDTDIDKAVDELEIFIQKQRGIYPKNEEYEDIHTLMDHLAEKYSFE